MSLRRASSTARRQPRPLVDPGDAEAGPGPGRLDEDRQPQPVPVRRRQFLPGPQGHPVGDPQPVRGEQRLGDRLVHPGGAGEDAVPDVRDAEPLQHRLDGAVLAVRAVQRREHHVLIGPARPAPRLRVAGAPSTRHSPSRPMSTSVTSYASRSRWARMLSAERRETSCSPLRPPNSTAIGSCRHAPREIGTRATRAPMPVNTSCGFVPAHRAHSATVGSAEPVASGRAPAPAGPARSGPDRTR